MDLRLARANPLTPCVRMQGAVCRYSTSPSPPHFNHTSYELSTEDKFEIMEVCHRYGVQAAADSTRAIQVDTVSCSDEFATVAWQLEHAAAVAIVQVFLPEDSMRLDESSEAGVCWLI